MPAGRPKLMRCKESHGNATHSYPRGMLLQSNHPAVKANPGLFEEAATQVRTTSSTPKVSD